MTSITAQTHATLDGVIDAPPADALLPYMSDAGRQGALDLALAADALLLARETWQGLARAWRDQRRLVAPASTLRGVANATLGFRVHAKAAAPSCRSVRGFDARGDRPRS